MAYGPSKYSNMNKNSNPASFHEGVLNAIPIPIITTNRELTILSINDATSKMLDMPSEAILGKKYNLFFQFTDGPIDNCFVLQAMRTYKPMKGQGIARIKGRRILVEYGAIPVADEQGQVTSVINYLVDRTDRQLFFEEITSLGDQIKSGAYNSRADLTNFPDPYRSALLTMNEMLDNLAKSISSEDFVESQFARVVSTAPFNSPHDSKIWEKNTEKYEIKTEKIKHLKITLDDSGMRSPMPRRRTRGRRIRG